MESVAKDAQWFHGLGPPIDNPTYDATQTFYPPMFLTEWWWALKAWLYTPDRPTSPDPYQPNKWVDIVAGMLSSVKNDILDASSTLLRYNGVFTSWPDFEANTGSLYSMRFRTACHQAGLDHLDGDIVSYLGLSSDGILLEESDESPFSMLVISYNAASLGITLIIRDDGLVWPGRLVESPESGAARRHVTGYWDNIKELLEAVVHDSVVDHLLLLGDHAYDPGLIMVINDMIMANNNINSSILDRYHSKGVDMDLPVYTAARQAARTAWRMIERKCGGREDPATNNAHLELQVLSVNGFE
ncbi:hypothetical protein BJX66DRAFT_161698 [Aspergillus keveii]|uniref:Uncharacterized protein n=1 Tax=Aspergillus keveii TaxID=714993 RepID=A0ABR4FHS9_9EURO